MGKRKAISQKTRFEVFKRDSFKCSYCGRSAPEIVLELDHVHPISKDGDESEFNYLTACQDCNRGKGARLLSDSTTIQKQKDQLDELQSRREQIDMMLEWRNGLKSITEDSIQIAVDAADAMMPGWSVNENGRTDIAKLVKKFGLQCVLEAVDTSKEQYIKYNAKGDATDESSSLALSKIGGICQLSSQPDWKKELYYLRGILRKRCNYFNDWQGLQILEDAYNEGVSLEELRWIATHVTSWTMFKSEAEDSVKTARKLEAKGNESNG